MQSWRAQQSFRPCTWQAQRSPSANPLLSPAPPSLAIAPAFFQAQQSALVSCIEEGERSLLASGRRASLSPQAVLSPSHWRSENTEEDGAGSEAESSSGGGGGFSTPVARRLGTGLGPLSPRASLQAQAS